MDVLVPEAEWPPDVQAVVVSWLYGDGATVRTGEVIAEVMIEKAQLDILAPGAGVLSIKVRADDVFNKGDVIASITPAG